MTTPNQQPEVSAEAREATDEISVWLYVSKRSRNKLEPIIQRAIDLATEKLRPVDCIERANELLLKERVQLRAENKKIAEELEAHAWEISPAMAQARIDQLNAELSAQKQCTEAEHRCFEIAREQVEKADVELANLKAENEALQKDYGTMTTLLEVQEGKLSALRKDNRELADVVVQDIGSIEALLMLVHQFVHSPMEKEIAFLKRSKAVLARRAAVAKGEVPCV